MFMCRIIRAGTSTETAGVGDGLVRLLFRPAGGLVLRRIPDDRPGKSRLKRFPKSIPTGLKIGKVPSWKERESVSVWAFWLP